MGQNIKHDHLLIKYKKRAINVLLCALKIVILQSFEYFVTELFGWTRSNRFSVPHQGSNLANCAPVMDVIDETRVK